MPNAKDMTNDQNKTQTPIINAHTHIFTKEHAPKYLAKKMLPKPLYKWFPTVPLVKIIKCYLKPETDDNFFYIPFRKLIRCYLNRNKDEEELEDKEQKSFYSYTTRNKRHKAYQDKKTRSKGLRKVLYYAYLILVWLIFAYYLFELILPLLNDTWFGWLCNCYINALWPIMPDLGNPWNSVLLLLFMTLLFGTIRSAIKSYIRGKFIKAIGKEKLDFLLRYINIARFSSHTGQVYIFNQLKQQYPEGSKFVVLPMDMEYMDAGPVEESYPEQMEKLIKLKKKIQNKDILLPFIFIDPRRIKADRKRYKKEIEEAKNLEEVKKQFLSFAASDSDKIELDDCLVNDYIKDGCAGIKIYPALGYYPFDKDLLPLWLYCQQENIPITTHCSIGPVFYRGDLKELGKNYDYHPIFKEVYKNNKVTGNPVPGPLRFHEFKNKDFQKNFTHPLNYLCLLHKPLLNEVVKKFDTEGDLKKLFVYDEKKEMITRDLSKLKINLAHYGSAQMWQEFLDQDRYDKANAIIQDPKNGLDLKGSIGNYKKRYDLWHNVDWFSIISSMIMQFDHVYTDISYTAHDLTYLNLLSEILDNPEISERVLFGTDFYVVSNHKTEKQYWIDMRNSLGATKWELIANQNPTKFLTSKLTGSI